MKNIGPSTEKATHMPGPWLVTTDGQAVYALTPNPDRASIRRGHPAEINRFYAGISKGENCTMDELRANARLIAAAPDLLAALKLLHDNLAEYQRINNIGGYDNHDMKMARAAIAKATA